MVASTPMVGSPGLRQTRNLTPWFLVDILYLLIPVSVVIVFAIGAVFWWANASGQFDELEREARSVIEDDESPS